MLEALKELRLAIGRLPRSGRRGRREYPSELRAKLMTYAGKRRREGVSIHGIARELGLPLSTLTQWSGSFPASTAPAGFRPVSVSASTSASTSPIVLVAPGGYRVEGLRLPDLTELLRALSS